MERKSDDNAENGSSQKAVNELNTLMTEAEAPEVEELIEEIRMGDAKIPPFLIVTYSLLAIWAFAYLLLAVPLNQVAHVDIDGETVFSKSCFGCHNVSSDYKIGPGMQGIRERYTEEQIQKILLNGLGTMPSLPNLGLNTEQIKAVKEYIITL